MRSRARLAAACLALAPIALAAAQDAPQIETELRLTLEAFRERDGFPGATAAISLPDGTIVAAAIGLVDAEAGRAMTAGTPMLAATAHGPVWGDGGWIAGYVSSLRHYADHGVAVAFQINTDIGSMDDTSDRVPTLEAALASLAIGAVP